jgi:hypothetical protein
MGCLGQQGRKCVLLHLIGVEQDGNPFLASLLIRSECSQQTPWGLARDIAPSW